MLSTSYQRKNTDNTVIDTNQNQQLQSEIISSYSFSNYAKAGLAILGTVGTVALVNTAGLFSSLGKSSDDIPNKQYQLINSQDAITFADNSLPIQPRYAKRAGFGGEFQVNTYTTSWQDVPSIARLTTNDFVVVWESGCYSSCSTGQDGDFGIYGQRFSSTGVPQGSEFQINTYTTDAQWKPSISGLTTGDFVIVWESYEQDGDSYGIYGQLFSSTGIPQGSEFQINTHTTLSQHDPAVAALSLGDFVVVWTSSGQDGGSYGIYGQRFSSTGIPQGSEFQVNTYTTSIQQHPSVAGLPTGDFVVMWESWQDGSSYGIYGQRFSSTGILQGSEFQINTYTTDWQGNPSAAALGTGDFVVTWQSSGQDGSQSGVYGQRFSNTGIPQGSEFQINTYTTDGQENPSAAALGTSDFVVAWASDGQDGDNKGIYGQRFSNTGIPQGSEFQINTYTTGWQGNPSAAALGTSDFVVTWQSSGQDGDGYGIYGRMYFDGNAPPVLMKNILIINKNETIILNTTHFSVTDSDNDDLTLTCIASNIQHGHFEQLSNEGMAITRFTPQEVIDGSIQFVHDGSTQLPSYSIDVTDGIVTSDSENATIVFVAQNQLVTKPGEQFVLGEKQLAIQSTIVTTELEIMLTNIQYGRFEKNLDPGVAISSFTLAELNSEAIQFVHGGSENTPQFRLQFKEISTNYIFPRSITGNTILNHAPIVLNPTGTLNWPLNKESTYQLPNTIFSDPDGQVLQLSVRALNDDPLPQWVQFDNATNILTGTPSTDGLYDFKIIARDPYDETAIDRFAIDIKTNNGTTIIGEGTNPAPIVAAIAGGAVLLTGGIVVGFWYRKNTKNQQTRKQHPFADYIRSELKLEGLDNFATSKGAQYVLAISYITAIFKENYGIDINRMGENELKRLAKQVALAAKSQITPKKSGLFQKSVITVEDLSDPNNAQAIARTVQRLAGDFEEITIVDNNTADNNLGTLVENGINTVRNVFSPKAEFV